MDFDTSTPCWFNLRDSTKSTKGLNTQKWSLKQNERKSGAITTGAAHPSTTATSSTATSTTASSTAAAESATTTPAAEASSSNSKGDDISAGAKAGLGIGVGIGTSLLCAGAFWLYYRHVKRKEHHQEVYRRIVGSGQGAGGGAGPGPSHDAYATPNNNYSEHLEPWRYGGTPQPAPSAWSGVSDPSTTDWYAAGHHSTTANAPYQYYDPVGSSHQLGAMAGAAGIGAGATYQYSQHQYQHSQPSVTTTASMTAEPPPPSTIPIPRSNPQPHPIQTDHVPEAAAIRDVQDLSTSLFPSEYNEPVSPVSAADRISIPPTRVASVNYGPNGPRDASTGADFTLLPDYTAPAGGAGQGGERADEEEDIYGPPTPRSPPPPHSAHAHIVAGGMMQQQHHQDISQQQQQIWQPDSQHSGVVVELPTAQTHRGYGPQAELPAGDVGVQQPPLLRQQRSDLRGPEQKVLLQDVATLRRGQRDGG